MWEPGGPERDLSVFGEDGSVPVVGDWDGNGTDSIGYGTGY